LRAAGHHLRALLPRRPLGPGARRVRPAARSDGRGEGGVMALLEIRDIRKRFGGLKALDGVGMDVSEGELVGLIGPNGSGKTTLLNVLSGHLRADAGEVRLDGRSVLGLDPTQLTRLGVLRMFQMTRVFNRVSAFDNL